MEGKAMNDLTILLKTANQLNENTAQKIRDYLLEVTENKYPIISVSQKPINFGKNICVGEIGVSKHNSYKQILIGVREVKTKYVACIDDDALYTPEYFLYRPSDDVFSYETNYWFAQPEKDYYWRVHDINKRGGMWSCISSTKLLLDNMTQRFKVYPTTAESRFLWGEPGINDRPYGIISKHERRWSEKPCVVFIHKVSMGYNQFRKFYRRYGYPLPEDKTESLEQFGNIKDLFINYFGKEVESEG